MTPLFQQLAQQAQLELFPAPQHGFAVVAGTDTHLEKFAQLLVEHCAQRAEAYAYMSPNFTALAEELRRINGVEQ
jgi:hypothetical protein